MTGAIPSPRRILVVSLDNLGDLVFAAALTPPLHAAFPNAVIDIWCKAYASPLAGLVPHVRNIIAADPFWAVAPNRPRPTVLPFLKSIGVIKRNAYDVAVLSEAPWRAAAAVASARIPARIGLARHRNARFLTHVLDAQDSHKPVLQEQARLLSALGIAPSKARYRLDAERLGPVRNEVAQQLPARFVAIHPFAGARDRCVPLAEWTQLAFALESRALKVLWVGTTPELDELRLSYTHPKGVYVDALSDGSLRATAAALSLATAFVGHDSGPLHIAAAFGTPVVGIFAPGQPDRTFPQGIGPWRMIRRDTPDGVSSAEILREIDELGVV